MAASNPDEIITGVKQAVAQEVNSLSPDAKIVITDYFNHSYMPDLVLEWNDAGKRDERPIFLRNDLRPGVTEAEVESLARREPVFLSLTAFEESPARRGSLRERAREANHVLVTDITSLADIATPFADEPSGRLGHDETPLLRLVQANVLKGGRGLLTTQDAERLTKSAAPADTGAVLTDQFIATFEQTADEMFAPDAALRLRRSAELLKFGLADGGMGAVSESTGQLSDVELRILVPYLLADETARANPRLWSYIGSMMSLERLEELGDTLTGVDVTALVVPNLETWMAKRAQLAVNSSFEDLEAASGVRGADIQESGEPFWYISNRILTADTGPWRLFIATDARRLKGRSENPAVNWDDISSLFSGLAIDAVDLRGVTRRIYVGGEGGSDVSGDVARIRNTINDSFKVAEVHVRRIGDDQSLGTLNVDFTEMMVTSNYRTSPIASLVRAAELLGHRRPPNFSALGADLPRS